MRIGPVIYPDFPAELEEFDAMYDGEVPVSMPLWDLDTMVARMPMRSTHGSLNPFKAGPLTCQPTRSPLHRRRPLLRLPLQR